MYQYERWFATIDILEELHCHIGETCVTVALSIAIYQNCLQQLASGFTRFATFALPNLLSKNRINSTFLGKYILRIPPVNQHDMEQQTNWFSISLCYTGGLSSSISLSR
jgi:hypothetical protein